MHVVQQLLIIVFHNKTPKVFCLTLSEVEEGSELAKKTRAELADLDDLDI